MACVPYAKATAQTHMRRPRYSGGLGERFFLSFPPRDPRRPAKPGRMSAASPPVRPSRVSVVSLNVLADSYAMQRDGRYSYIKAAHIRWEYRKGLLLAAVRRLDPDVLCLQEVDHYRDFWAESLVDLGYASHYTQRAGGKTDGCLMGWKKTRFELSRGAKGAPLVYDIDMNALARAAPKHQRFRFNRHNVGQVVFLSERVGTHRLVVCNCHLYWNPEYRDVKAQQTALLLRRLHHVLNGSGIGLNPAVILCGDFNSDPGSIVDRFIRTGNATLSRLSSGPFSPVQPAPSQKLLMADGNLDRVARWLRSVGVDTMMHEWPGEAGNQSRDSASCEALFKRAREAGRILVTRSKKLIKRRTCPQYIFVTESNHEKAFQQIAKLMQLRFESEKIFRRCTKCNGQFETVSPDRLKTIEGLPEGLRDGVDKATGKKLKFYICLEESCKQIYWWGSKSKSAADGFKRMLQETQRGQGGDIKVAQRGGDKKTDTDRKRKGNDAKKTPVDKIVPSRQGGGVVQQDAKDGKAGGDRAKTVAAATADEFAAEISNSVTLTHQVPLRTAFDADPNRNTTNVTDTFTGQIDHIYYSERALRCVAATAPAAAAGLDQGKSKVPPQPSAEWPSDHLPLCAVFEFVPPSKRLGPAADAKLMRKDAARALD